MTTTTQALPPVNPEHNIVHFSLENANYSVAAVIPSSKSTCEELSAEQQHLQASYFERERKKFIHLWDYSKYIHKEPVVHLTVDRNGGLSSIQIVHSSDDSDMDKEALELVKAALPLDPFPSTIKAATLNFFLSPAKSKYLGNSTSKEALESDLNQAMWNNQTWINNTYYMLYRKWAALHLPPGKSVSMLILVYEKTGEVVSKKIIKSSCDPIIDQLAFSLIDPILSKPNWASGTGLLQLKLDFKTKSRYSNNFKFKIPI